MYSYYNKKYTRDYYDDSSSSEDDDEYDTPLAQDMSRTDKQIAELLYNLNHVNDRPAPKSNISDEVRKKRAENLAKAREARMNKLKNKDNVGGGLNIPQHQHQQQQQQQQQKSIRMQGDGDPYASTTKTSSIRGNGSGGGGGGLKVPPPDAPMPGDNAVMPVYF